jgi:hypothetical protein
MPVTGARIQRGNPAAGAKKWSLVLCLFNVHEYIRSTNTLVHVEMQFE